MPTDLDILKEHYRRVIEEAMEKIGLTEILRLCETMCLRRSGNIAEHSSAAGVHTAANWDTAASRCVANLSSYPVSKLH